MIAAIGLVALVLAAEPTSQVAPATEPSLPKNFPKDLPNLPGPPMTVRERIFQHSCYMGIATAQAAFPKAPNDEEMMQRGFRSCEGAILRMRESAALEKEKDVVEFACGYAVGAMFAKYGAGDDVKRMSPRAVRALERCATRVHADGL